MQLLLFSHFHNTFILKSSILAISLYKLHFIYIGGNTYDDQFKDVGLVYPNGTEGLKKINVTINDGEFVVIVGLSGAGKSTFIRSINRLVTPTSGSLLVDNEDILKYRGSDMRKLRTKTGMIFQNYNLVKRSNVLKNVLAGRLGHTSTLRSIFNLHKKEDVGLAYESLQRVNIAEKIYNRADELSGGQQQRVSIARVLTQQPKYILADEPVASLIHQHPIKS